MVAPVHKVGRRLGWYYRVPNDYSLTVTLINVKYEAEVFSGLYKKMQPFGCFF